VFDPPLTSLPLVATSFSSTPVTTSINDLTLLTSSFPLAQCIGLGIGKTYRVYACVLEDASLVWLEEPILVQQCPEETPFEEFLIL